MSNNDTEIIACILDGDTEQFRSLVDHHKDSLYRHCFFILRDEDAAEDVAQEAFIKAYTKLASYDDSRASFRTWLFTIATRQCLDYLRSAKHVPMPLVLDDAIPDTQLDLPDAAARKNELYHSVLRLPPKYRTVTLLYYWHGYSYSDISAYMNIPVGTVRSWLHRAKQQLKEALV